MGSKLLYSLPFCEKLNNNHKLIQLTQNQNEECRMIVKNNSISCDYASEPPSQLQRNICQ